LGNVSGYDLYMAKDVVDWSKREGLYANDGRFPFQVCFSDFNIYSFYSIDYDEYYNGDYDYGEENNGETGREGNCNWNVIIPKHVFECLFIRFDIIPISFTIVFTRCSARCWM
jgi:hypothetical protein